MQAISVYLNFDGKTRDAMTFYHECLGGTLDIQTFAEAHADVPGAADLVMHARITNGPAVLMASDAPPGMSFQQGNNFSVSIQCDSAEEVDRLTRALAERGKLTMEPADQFWGARFGMATDKFGVNWMFNHEYPKKA